MHVNIGCLKGQRGASTQVDLQVDSLPGAEWGEGVRLIAPIHVVATVTNTGKCYLVRGTITTSLELQCNRCLKPYRWDLQAPLDEEYFQKSEVRREQDNVGMEQFAEESIFTGDTINLTEAVREQAELTVPYKLLCKDDCAGLCSICGTDLNLDKCGCVRETTDPRLADLARLLEGNFTDRSGKKHK